LFQVSNNPSTQSIIAGTAPEKRAIFYADYFEVCKVLNTVLRLAVLFWIVRPRAVAVVSGMH
jgi:hypothetical protein